jgi:hypothetical protein
MRFSTGKFIAINLTEAQSRDYWQAPQSKLSETIRALRVKAPVQIEPYHRPETNPLPELSMALAANPTRKCRDANWANGQQKPKS